MASDLITIRGLHTQIPLLDALLLSCSRHSWEDGMGSTHAKVTDAYILLFQKVAGLRIYSAL
jgi:hypothetical protein